MSHSRYFALIPAAGVGARMGAYCPKQYLHIAGKAILRYAVDAFLANAAINHTYVVVSADDAFIDEVVPAGLARVTVLRCGGATRKDSVMNGLDAIQATLADDDWVLVHDAARPGLTPMLIHKLIDAIGEHAVGGLLALPVVDTVKRQDASRVQTIAREGLWLAQTPQMFRYPLLRRALQEVEHVTDEASAIEALGLTPSLVEGHLCNLKVTLPSDLEIAKCLLGLV
ncbi:MAG: 2-C-methyl-D-erythritol 4-phosphate cytidylyltransferase [Pseudomonadota bacterium]